MGKTLSYVLPMLRHIKDQAPIEQGDGPIGMIMGPTRELVTQIGKDCKRFGRAVAITAVSVYGGSGRALPSFPFQLICQFLCGIVG